MLKRKGFTLIELIVVMAILGILIFLGAPKYRAYTEDARMTKYAVETKELEKASQQYYIRNNDWPRLQDADDPLEMSEVKNLIAVNKLKIEVDEGANYYNIDLNKIKNYIQGDIEIERYVLQNPVGDVYAVESEKPVKDLWGRKPSAIITTQYDTIWTGVSVGWDYSSSIGYKGTAIVEAEWLNKQDVYSTAGTYKVGLRVKDEKGVWSDWVEKELIVEEFISASTSGTRVWEVPYTGLYRLEVYGGRGGDGGDWRNGYGGGSSGKSGSYGSKEIGVFELKAGDILYMKQGSQGSKGSTSYRSDWWAPGGSGGGESYIRLNVDSSANTIISAKGGRGGNGAYDSGSGGAGLGSNRNYGTDKQSGGAGRSGYVYVVRIKGV